MRGSVKEILKLYKRWSFHHQRVYVAEMMIQDSEH